LDDHGDGNLDFKHFKQLFAVNGINISHEQLKAIFETVDNDGKSGVS